MRPAYPTGTPKTTTFEAFKVKASKGYPVAKKIFWYMNTAGEAMFAIIRFEEAQSIFEPGAKPAKTFRPLTLWRMEESVNFALHDLELVRVCRAQPPKHLRELVP